MVAEGSRLGPYEIVSKIGAGGMGEVWRAKDTRLERNVAVKILPAEFASSAPLKLRFEREAKTISQLNHPNICTLHDVGHDNGTDFLVMELIDGESLSSRLARGPMPLQEVIRVGAQIADALDRAHRAGVVHRDLKPGNIMLTKTGAKLLDFGLAKSGGVFDSTSGSSVHADQATALRDRASLTEQGTILGTFQYMAPEQLDGAEADARSDIFALGAVLYEMTTGRRAFEGKTKTSLIAAIVDRDPPPISSIQPMSPPALERVINTCLAKNPDDRWQSAHDIASELRWISEAGSQAGVSAPMAGRRKRREAVAWVVAAIAIALAIPLAWEAYVNRTRPLEPLHVTILPPKDADFRLGGGMALSPDGRRLAFVGTTRAGQNLLFIRALRDTKVTPVNGSSDATYPFWSPDSRHVAFFAGNKLKRVDATGGPAQTICEAPNARGGAWSSNGTILFGLVRDSLYQVPAAGGSPAKVTTFDPGKGEADHRWPSFLPDGKRFLFLARAEDPEESVAWLGTLGSAERKRITTASAEVRYLNGHLLFTREKTLLAQGFDLRGAELKGTAQPIAEGISYFVGTAGAAYTASDSMIVFAQGSERSQLTWYDVHGKELGTVGEPNEYGSISLSPDGTRVAVDVNDTARKLDIWIHDLSRSTATRFTFKPADEFSPVWSPDGEQIAFSAGPKRPAFDLMIKSARTSGVEQVAWEDPESQRIPASWSASGRILVSMHNPKRKVINDIWLYSLPDRKATPLVESPFSESPGTLSPDGEWFVYSSNESGRHEIYAQQIGRPGKWQISTNGGFTARWSAKGDAIYYVTLDRKLTMVPVRVGKTFEAGDPKTLFELRISPGVVPTYDVTRDGSRILALRMTDDSLIAPLTAITNWTELGGREK